jgi:hypothetical protein
MTCLFFDIFCESACSGVSKISYVFFLQALLGQQVPQHDVEWGVQNFPKIIFFDDFFYFSKGYLVEFFENFCDTSLVQLALASWAKSCCIDNF